jgi:hypothetical protein
LLPPRSRICKRRLHVVDGAVLGVSRCL